MNPTNSRSAAAIIYYRLDGRLYHWVIDADAAQDTVESLKVHLEKRIPGAEFVEARTEKMNPVLRDTANQHERMRWALYLTNDATRIETSDGHTLSCEQGVWYGYMKREGIMSRAFAWFAPIKDEAGQPKAFQTSMDAYQACLEAAGYFDKIAEAERQQQEVVECSAAL